MTNAGKIEEATKRPWKIADLHAQGLYLNSGEISLVAVSERLDGSTHIGTISAHTKAKRGEQYRVKCPERDANAALIVRAVNAYPQIEAMRKALEEAKTYFNENMDHFFGIGHDIPLAVATSMLISEIDAALQPLKKEAE